MSRRRIPPAAFGAGLLALAAVVLAATALGPVDLPFVDAPPKALPAPRFVEEAVAAGVEHAYDGEFEFFVGGGVAAFDCDDDERPELYVAGGTVAAALYRNRSPLAGSLRFERVASAATDLDGVTGAYPLDVDGDRRVDLAVLRRGENVLLRGRGNCEFERANDAWAFDGGDEWTAAFSAAWERGATWPTVAIGNYLVGDGSDPDRLCDDNQLVRPVASTGAFGPPISLSPGWCALSMLFSDWDRSGRRDLRISNDRHYYSDYGDGQEELWRIAPGEAPRAYTAEDGWQTVRVWGMGIASQDLTGDGYPEVYLTSQGDNKLQALADGPARPEYRDIALARNATVHRPYAGDTTLPSTAWHAEFEDVNADGFMDLFVAKGNVEAQPDHAMRDPNNLLLGQPDGTFIEAAEAAGIVRFASARGAALVDLNLDGLLDLVVVNRRENVEIWRNTGTGDTNRPARMGNWLAILADQPGPNRYAVGAWIEVRAKDRVVAREVTVGGGHAGGQLGWIHVGLGRAERADVRVTWPDGETGPWEGVEANGFVVLERGAGPRTWDPPEE